MRLPLVRSFLKAGGFSVCLAVVSQSAVAAELVIAKPVIFVVGDSTARNSGKGKNGEPVAGWGAPLAEYFDSAKVEVSNVAHAGQSSRTYYNNPGDWPSVLPKIKSGDFVLLVFGINDGGPPTAIDSRGSIPGLGDETVNLARDDGTTETAHTYGWYMSGMATAGGGQRSAGLFSHRHDAQHLDEPQSEVSRLHAHRSAPGGLRSQARSDRTRHLRRALHPMDEGARGKPAPAGSRSDESLRRPLRGDGTRSREPFLQRP